MYTNKSLFLLAHILSGNLNKTDIILCFNNKIMQFR